MSQDIATELEQIGRDAARTIAGDDAIKEVEVVPGHDLERPVYYFTFLIDQERSRQRLGLLLTRLVQRLRDELIARSDGHYPVVRLLNRVDWDSRSGAGPR